MNARTNTKVGRMTLNSPFTAFALALVAFLLVSTTSAEAGLGKGQKARKYRVTQISEQDVELGDTSLDALLQSDKLPSLLNDPQFGEMMTSEDFKKVLENENFKKLLNSEDNGHVWIYWYSYYKSNYWWVRYQYNIGFCDRKNGVIVGCWYNN